VLAIGGSAGSVEALVEVVARLPADLPAAVLVTVHIGGHSRGSLPRILARSGPLPAAHARHGEPLRPGRIYVAPPGFHLLAAAGVARLSGGPRVNRHRPAIDVMFASAARWGRGRAVAVVLSGVLDDGAVGAALTARAGGRVVVQAPADALFDSMPRAALSAVRGALVAPAAELAEVVVKTVHELLDGRPGGGTDAEGGDPEVVGMRMGDSDDPGYLSADEAAHPPVVPGVQRRPGRGRPDRDPLLPLPRGPPVQPAVARGGAARVRGVEAVDGRRGAGGARRPGPAPRRPVDPDADADAAAAYYRNAADRSALAARSLLTSLQDRTATTPVDVGDGGGPGPR
jgi:hypothetical protein